MTLERALAVQASRPVVLWTPTRSVTLGPATAGLALDVDGTLAGTTGLTLSPTRMWQHLAGVRARPVRISVDHARLTAALRQAARMVDVPATEGSVSFPHGSVRTVLSEPGRAVQLP